MIMGCSMHKPQAIGGGVGLKRRYRAIGKLIPVCCAVLALVAVLIKLALRIRRHIGAIA